jgi:hypothetical protein
MQLDTFLIADAVAAPPDGKFYIHGGGLTNLTLPVVPFAVPQLGVLARFAVTEQELREPHSFEIRFTDPDGAPAGAPLPAFSSAALEPPELAEGEERFLALALNIGGILVLRVGLHRLSIHVDGDERGARPLPISVVSPDRLVGTTTPPAALATPPPSPPGPNRAARRGQQPRRKR